MLIRDKEEFEKYYPYKGCVIKKYPKEYPCIAKIETEERGIMGDERIVYVAYYPKDSSDLFLDGLFYKWEKL